MWLSPKAPYLLVILFDNKSDCLGVKCMVFGTKQHVTNGINF